MRKISPATVLAVVAIVVASAGTATAVTLVTGKQVKNNSLTGRDIKNRSLTGKDIRPGAIGARQLAAGLGGAPGPKGDKGDKGDTGANGTPDPSAFYDKAASDDRFQARYRTTHVVRGDGTPAENGQRLLDVLADVPEGSAVADARLVLLEPGRFDVGADAVQMKDFVDLAGSGAGVTRVVGTGSVVLHGADDATLRDIAVVQAGQSSSAYAVRTDGVRFRIHDAALVVEGTQPLARGLAVDAGDTTARDTTVRVTGDVAEGVWVRGALDATNIDVAADAVVGDYSNTALLASDGTTMVRDSRLHAPDAAIGDAAVVRDTQSGSPTVRIATSELDSPIPAVGGVTCLYSWRGTSTLDGSCS